MNRIRSTRKTWMQGAATFIALGLLAGCTGGTEEQTFDLPAPVAGEIDSNALDGANLTFVGYGGATQDAQSDAFVKPFAEISGAEIREETEQSPAKLRAMVDRGEVTWDVVYAYTTWVQLHCGEYAEKIDWSKIDGSEVPEELIIDECSVPLEAEAEIIVYDGDKFKDDPPTSMDDFFDTEKYPGKRMIPGDQATPNAYIPQVVQYYLDGRQGNGVPYDAEEVFAKLDTLKPDDLLFWESYSDSQQKLESEDIAMAWVAVGRPYAANLAGSNWQPIWQDCGYVVASMYIPKGSPHVDAAHALMNYAIGAQQQAKITEGVVYAPINPNAEPNIDADMEPFYMDGDRQQECIQVDQSFLAENYDDITDAWLDWLANS